MRQKQSLLHKRRSTREKLTSPPGTLKVVGAFVAAILAATVAAASLTMPLTSGDPRTPGAPMTSTTAPSGSTSLDGEHALEYLNRLAREAVAAGKSASDASGTPRREPCQRRRLTESCPTRRTWWGGRHQRWIPEPLRHGHHAMNDALPRQHSTSRTESRP